MNTTAPILDCTSIFMPVAPPAMSANTVMIGDKGNKKDQRMWSYGESLYSMAMYDMGTSSTSAPAAPKKQPQFLQCDQYKDLSLREILDLSEDCVFSDDEDYSPMAAVQPNAASAFLQLPFPPLSDAASAFLQLPSHPLSVPPLPVPSAPAMSQEDLEWSELEEVPMMTQSIDDIPVAAALVASIDECTSSSKRSCPDLLLDEYLDDEEGSDENGVRFRPYQTGQWSEKFAELCDYRQKNGHCLVPHTYRANLPLARWVKRQRYQYKLLNEKKTSTMTDERVKALEEIGFIWDSQGAAWGERLSELKEFKKAFGHCNVPSNYSENPQLATWVKCQRRQYKLFMEGKPSNMTSQRIAELNELGFEWELRSYKRQKIQ